jgi:hypothetical protein
MRLSPCDCRPAHYRRGHRPWWLKLVSDRRLYHCYACDAYLFISPEQFHGVRQAPVLKPPAGIAVALKQT